MFTTETQTRITLKNVLFATDFSPISEAAFQYAAAIARRFGSTLHAVHVVPVPTNNSSHAKEDVGGQPVQVFSSLLAEGFRLPMELLVGTTGS